MSYDNYPGPGNDVPRMRGPYDHVYPADWPLEASPEAERKPGKDAVPEPIQSSDPDPFHARYWEGAHRGRQSILEALARALTAAGLGAELLEALSDAEDGGSGCGEEL